MNVVLFMGPTLPVDVALQGGDLRRADSGVVVVSSNGGRVLARASIRPPAQQGDLYRAACERPQIIGLVDGLFDQVNAVAHKEILWAMSKGIHVYGGASMGALRAVEMVAFGMRGIGQIFEHFRDGHLEDDDEVAVAYAPADLGYRALSEPMVNVRETVSAAVLEGVISPDFGLMLVQVTKSLFYTDRCYPLIFDLVAEHGADRAQLEEFRQFLTRGRVDRKQLDALALIAAIRCQLETGVEPQRVSYCFANTDAWENIRHHAGESGADDPASGVTVYRRPQPRS